MPLSATNAPPARPVPRSIQRARSLSGELRSLFKARRQNLAAIAHGLARMKREELYRDLGYSSVFTYAADQHGMGKSKVSELIGISEGSDRLPQVREAFDSGRLEWTKAREIARVATPETEADWLQLATRATGDELRAARKGDAAVRRRVLSFSLEDTALYDQLIAAAKQELGVDSEGDVVLALLQRGAGGGGAEAPHALVVISECASCRLATTETREGPIALSSQAVARARCSGEARDRREQSNPIPRKASGPVGRGVSARAWERCQVPGCRAGRLLEVHRAGGSKLQDEPWSRLTLCVAHHRAVHDGFLLIEGVGPTFRFVLLDGEVLGTVTVPFGQDVAPGAFSDENSPVGSPGVSDAKVGTAAPEGGGGETAATPRLARARARSGASPLGADLGSVAKTQSASEPFQAGAGVGPERHRLALQALEALGLSELEARARLLHAGARVDLGQLTVAEILRAVLRAG